MIKKFINFIVFGVLTYWLWQLFSNNTPKRKMHRSKNTTWLLYFFSTTFMIVLNGLVLNGKGFVSEYGNLLIPIIQFICMKLFFTITYYLNNTSNSNSKDPTNYITNFDGSLAYLLSIIFSLIIYTIISLVDENKHDFSSTIILFAFPLGLLIPVDNAFEIKDTNLDQSALSWIRKSVQALGHKICDLVKTIHENHSHFIIGIITNVILSVLIILIFIHPTIHSTLNKILPEPAAWGILLGSVVFYIRFRVQKTDNHSTK